LRITLTGAVKNKTLFTVVAICLCSVYNNTNDKFMCGSNQM
jgi:hypothetical protein